MSPRRKGRRSSPGASHADEVVGLQAVSESVIYRHVFENADREVGGVLVGRSAADGGLPLLTGAIPAISADEQRATLTFTQAAWAHVHRVLESEFPLDEQIVGWYHSHPGFGIFLSGHDLFIHENFFSGPSQIAVVVDPHARMEGAFAWRGGALKPLFERPTPGGWRTDRLAQGAASTARSGNSHPTATTEGHAHYPLLALAIAAILGVMIGFGIWSIAEGGTSTSPHPKSSSGAAKARVVRTTTVRQSHVEVIK